jgi:hypothetical protein
MDTGQAFAPTAAAPSSARTRWLWPTTRALGAVATIAVGVAHLQQYFKLYSEVPTIGVLFVLNFFGASAIGLVLLAPVERLARRWGAAAVLLAAVAGIGLAATSFVFLLVAEHTSLFGFHEPGYDPAAIAFTRVAEIAAVVLLGAYVAGHFRTRAHRRSAT